MLKGRIPLLLALAPGGAILGNTGAAARQAQLVHEVRVK